jgi:metal-responsive CopG/Arc/MetJ family transcriptional regulator
VRRGETKGAVPFLVSIPDPQPRAVRVNVTFSPEVLEEIDAAAEREHVSRSAFLAKAAMARAGDARRDRKRPASSSRRARRS